MGSRPSFSGLIDAIGQRLHGAASSGVSGSPPVIDPEAPTPRRQKSIQENKDQQEKSKENLTEENSSQWSHILKVFFYRTMPEIAGSVLKKVIGSFLNLIGRLLIALSPWIILLIALFIAWKFYIRSIVIRFIYWFFTPLRVINNYTSRSVHAFRDEMGRLGHGIAHGTSSIAHGVGSGARALGHGVAGIGHGIVHGTSSIAHGVGSGAQSLGHGAVWIRHGIAHDISPAVHEVGRVVFGFLEKG